ncbi:MAG TPA: DUF2239 family protein [Pseudorhodoferax sp.]|nr:DUF2239 family protein [Pseudorhodoferax sp.]
MAPELPPSFTCFDGHRRVATASLPAIALVLKQLQATGPAAPALVFDNQSGRSIDLDTRGSDEEVLARLALAFPALCAGPAPDAAPVPAPADEPRGRGRPKLGVVAREVTLLPRHWDWLGQQPGGASVALRKLVEQARHAGSERDRQRQAHERAYHFMSAIAGDLPGFEEASRALFANARERFRGLVAAWPADIREHAEHLGFDTAAAQDTLGQSSASPTPAPRPRA